jgi:hypothetical protein
MSLFALRDRWPGTTSLLGTLSGWSSVALLQAAQVAAAVLAALVSLASLILVAPRVCAEIRRWRREGFLPRD